jgi:hypothetical protein
VNDNCTVNCEKSQHRTTLRMRQLKVSANTAAVSPSLEIEWHVCAECQSFYVGHDDEPVCVPSQLDRKQWTLVHTG